MSSSNEGRHDMHARHRTRDRERGTDTRDNDCTVTTHHSTRVWLNGVATQVFFGPFPTAPLIPSAKEWCSVPLYETGSTCHLREPRTWKEIPKGIITRVGVKNLHRADDHGDQRTHREDGARDDVIAVVSAETPTWKHTSMDWNPQPKDALTST